MNLGNGPERILRVLAAAGDDGVRPGELTSRSGVPDGSCRRHVRRLIELGLARRDSPVGPLHTTPAGVEAASQLDEHSAGRAATHAPAAVQPEPDNGARLADVDDAIAELPGELQAAIRLALGAACYRWHCRADRPSGHLGVIAAGPPGIGKTVAGLAAAKALGAGMAERKPYGETERSLWIRRTQLPGGEFTITASPVLAQPIVVLGEFEKAAGELRTAALRLLQGEARIPAEGLDVDIACTSWFSLNPKPGQTSADAMRAIPESYWRRNAIHVGDGLPRLARDVADRVLDAMPVLPLSHLRPPQPGLPASLLDDLAEAVAGGELILDERAIEAAALGYAGLAGDGDLDAALDRALDDYLTLAGTCAGLVSRTRAAAQNAARQDQAGQTPEAYEAGIAALMIATSRQAELRAVMGDLAGILDDAPPRFQQRFDALFRATRIVHRDLGTVRSPGSLARVIGAADMILSQCRDLADQAVPYAVAAAGAQGAETTAQLMEAELDRRARAIGFAGQDQDAVPGQDVVPGLPPAADTEVVLTGRVLPAESPMMAGARSLSRPPARPSHEPPRELVPFRQPGLYLETGLRPAPAPPAARQPQRPPAAIPYADAYPVTHPVAARTGRARPAGDTTVAAAVWRETERRRAAGMPDMTPAELAGLYLAEPQQPAAVITDARPSRRRFGRRVA